MHKHWLWIWFLTMTGSCRCLRAHTKPRKWAEGNAAELPAFAKEDSCSHTEQERERKEETKGTGHSAQRTAEEYELSEGRCMRNRESRTQGIDTGNTGREGLQVKLLKVTPCPHHRDPKSLNYQLASLRRELQTVLHFWSKILTALKNQFQNLWIWDTQARLTLHYLQPLWLNSSFVEWRKHKPLIHMMRIKVTLCTVKKSKGIRGNKLPLSEGYQLPTHWAKLSPFSALNTAGPWEKHCILKDINAYANEDNLETITQSQSLLPLFRQWKWFTAAENSSGFGAGVPAEGNAVLRTAGPYLLRASRSSSWVWSSLSVRLKTSRPYWGW